VTSDDVCNHIRSSWPDICGDVPADPPEFAKPTHSTIDIVVRTGSLVPQVIRVDTWPAGDSVDLLDGRLTALATLTRSGDGATVTASWKGGAPETLPVQNGAFTIAIAGGLYALRRGTSEQIFKAGQDDVHV
jgi:hypothetical protein